MESKNLAETITTNRDFLINGGEMGDRIRSADWSLTALGSMERWPQSLKTALNICLNSPAPASVIWGEQHFQFYNDAYFSWIGYRESESFGSTLSIAFPELQRKVEEAFLGHSVWIENESIITSGDGISGHFNMSFTPLLNEGGKVGGVFHTLVETTGKETGAEAKREPGIHMSANTSESILKVEPGHLLNLFMEAPVSFAVFTGPDLIFEFANKQYRKLVGANRNIDGKPLFEVIPDVSPDLVEILKKVAFEGEVFKASEKPVILDWDENKEPYPKYFNLLYEPLFDENKKPNGLMFVGYEVTEQVISKKSIQENESKYRSLVETMDQGFTVFEMIFDNSGKPVDYRFLEVNPVFEQQTGLINPVGKTALELVPNLEKHWVEIYGNVALTGETTRFVEGSEAMGRWFEVFAFRLGGAESRKVALLFTDISERKQAEEKMRIKNEQLLKINNDLDNFIYTASHDLKAPVSNLEGLFNTLLDEVKLNEDLLVFKTLIEESFDRFKSTITDLTEITKMQKAGSEEAEMVVFSDIIEEIKIGVQDQIEKYDAEVQTQFEVSEINFSRKNLRSILYNFLSNAIKYSSPDRKPIVRITTERRNNSVLLIIADNGLGIPPESQSKVFQMFKRVHDHVEGTGIGLYIVKRIVDNAGGRIEIESEVGKGSTFKIFLKDRREQSREQ